MDSSESLHYSRFKTGYILTCFVVTVCIVIKQAWDEVLSVVLMCLPVRKHPLISADCKHRQV